MDKRKKYEKSHKLAGKSVSRKKKGEREVCLLFWLKIYSIIGNFNWKLVWRQVPKLEVLWVFFFQFFLLYSRAILSFSLSPSLLLCPFHCFNFWIILENLSCWNSIGLALISFFLVFGYCLSLCFLACELPYRELERRIGAIPWRIWDKKQGVNHLMSYWITKHSKLSETPKKE